MNQYDKKVQLALKQTDVAAALEEWAAYASNNGLQWETRLVWNSPRRRDGLIHASSVSNSCDKFLWLEAMDAEPKSRNDPGLQLIFDTGTAIHEQMQYYQGTRARDKGYLYEDEVKFGPDNSLYGRELRLCGSADGVSSGWPIRQPVVWEYKTISSKGFSKLTSPLSPHVVQGHVYMKCLGIPCIIFVYINKDKTGFAAYKVHFDQSVWDSIEQRLLTILKMVDNIEEPAGVNNSQCFKCKFFDECEPDVQRPYKHKVKYSDT